MCNGRFELGRRCEDFHECPECGGPIQMLGGVILKNCPHCDADFTKYIDEEGNVKSCDVIMAASDPAAPAE